MKISALLVIASFFSVFAARATAAEISYPSDATITTNLVFAPDAGIAVAEGATVRALGSMTAQGVLSKTGRGDFVLATAAINGKSNGGEKAALQVNEGTFSVDTPSAVGSAFALGVTVAGNATLNVRSGQLSAPETTLQGGNVIVSGGKFDGGAIEGAADISVSGGEFSAGFFVASGGATRLEIAEGATFSVENLSAASDGTLEIHANGGTIRSLQDEYNDTLQGGTVSVGAKGLTIDVSDTYAWGPQWKMPLVAAPGASAAEVRIVSSYEDANPAEVKRLRFAEGCTFSGVSAVRVDNAEVMLLDDEYSVPFSIGGDAAIRTAYKPEISVEKLSFDGGDGRLMLGVAADGSMVPVLVARQFVPPSRELRVRFFKTDTTSTVYPTVESVDFLKIPANVDFPLKRLTYAAKRTGYTVRFSERVEGNWRIFTITSEAQVAGATFLDPHSTDDWMTGSLPWLVNNTLYAYGGGTRTVSALMLANPGGSEKRNAMIDIPAGVTLALAGGAQQMLGGFAKFGDGTLAFTGEKAYDFAYSFTVDANRELRSGIEASYLSITNASGVSTGTHQASLTVAAGTLAIGTGADAPLVSVESGELNVGTATTSANATERDAAMVVNSGTLNILRGALVVGRTHGIVATQKQTPLRSSLAVNGGIISAKSAGVAVDVTAKSSMDASFAVNGGAVDCRNEFRLGENGAGAAAASTAKLDVTGGTLDIGREAAAQGVEGRLLAGNASAANLTTAFSVKGGTVTLHAGALFAKTAHHTVNLEEGGTLAIGGDFKADASAGSSVWNWNGGVLKFSGAAVVSGFKTVNVGKKDAVVVVDNLDGTSHFNQALSGEGRLILRSTDERASLHVYGNYDGCAGLVIEAPLRAIVRKNPVAGFPVLVKNGAGIVTYYSRTYPLLTMGETASDATSLLGYDYGGELYRPTVSGTLTVNGKVYVGYRYVTTGRLSLPRGTRELLRAPKGQIDLAKFEIHPELLARGAVATLSLDTTSNATYDLLVAEVTVDPYESAWTAGASGDWDDAGNWSAAPFQPDGAVRFPATLAGDATVDFDRARIRHIYHDGPGTLTLGGAIDLLSFAEYDISQPTGVLAFGSLLSIANSFTSSRTSGAGTLRIDGKLTGSPEIVANSGRIEGAPGAFGTATLKLANTTVRFTESGTFSGSIVHEASDATGVGVEIPEGKTVYATGALSNESALQKLGPGTVVFCRTGTKASVTNYVGRKGKAQTTVPYLHGTNGDVPNGTSLGVYAGTIAFDGDANTKYTVSDAVWVGSHPVVDGKGGAYDANLEVYGGTLTVGSLALNRLVNANYDAVDKLGLKRSPRSAVTVYGGTLRVLGGFIMGYPNYKSSCISELNVYGGLFEVRGTGVPSGFGVGYHSSSVVTTPGELSSVINLYGGEILKSSPGNISFGGYTSEGKNWHNVTCNIYGGVLRMSSETNGINLAYKNIRCKFNLMGGLVDVAFITSSTAVNDNRTIDFLMDGGTYRQRAADRDFPKYKMTSFKVGAGGAKFDLCENNKIRLVQKLTTADGVEKDGGLSLTATGDALMTLGVENAFNGPLAVNGGRMKPTVAAAASCAEGVLLENGGVFDANDFPFAFSYLRGSGAYTNGAVAVIGEVEPRGNGLTVEKVLTFRDKAVLKCAVSGDGKSGWAAPVLSLGQSPVLEKTAYLDIVREGEPLLPGFKVKVARVAADGAFPHFLIRGSVADNACFTTRRYPGADGSTEVYVETVKKGLTIFVR